MPTTRSIRDDASRVRRSTSDADTRKLADTVEELAKKVISLESDIETLVEEINRLKSRKQS
jgi:outer membrane murein-binding lipoprotein Lpp